MELNAHSKIILILENFNVHLILWYILLLCTVHICKIYCLNKKHIKLGTNYTFHQIILNFDGRVLMTL